MNLVFSCCFFSQWAFMGLSLLSHGWQIAQLSFKQCVLNPSSSWWHSLGVTQLFPFHTPWKPNFLHEGHQRFPSGYMACAEFYLFVLLFYLSTNFCCLLLPPGLLGTQTVLLLPEENTKFYLFISPSSPSPRIATNNICHDLKDYPAYRCVEIMTMSTQDSMTDEDTEDSILWISLF